MLLELLDEEGSRHELICLRVQSLLSCGFLAVKYLSEVFDLGALVGRRAYERHAALAKLLVFHFYAMVVNLQVRVLRIDVRTVQSLSH